MKNFISDSVRIMLDFLETLEGYHELISLKTIQNENTEKYKIFKIHYLNQSGDNITLRIELDFKKNKLSSGTWGLSELQTTKFEIFTSYHIRFYDVN
jgi:hypothetical protein